MKLGEYETVMKIILVVPECYDSPEASERDFAGVDLEVWHGKMLPREIQERVVKQRRMWTTVDV